MNRQRSEKVRRGGASRKTRQSLRNGGRRIWNEYLFGVVFTSGREQPITAALVALATDGTNVRVYDVLSAAVLIAALPPLLIYFGGGKYFVRGLTQGAIK